MRRISSTMKRDIADIMTRKMKAKQTYVIRHESVEQAIVIKSLIPKLFPDKHSLNQLSAYYLMETANKIAKDYTMDLISVDILDDAPEGYWSIIIVLIEPTSI